MTKTCSLRVGEVSENTEKNSKFDVLIVGAGPAGLSAGIWCADLGLKAAVIEQEAAAGGQLLKIFNPVRNYPGVLTNKGEELRDLFVRSAEDMGVSPMFSGPVVEFDAENGVVIDKDGNRYSADYFIFATGVSRRKLKVAGEDRLVGKGILESGSRDREAVAGKTVAVVGGGDAALENALILSEFASRVYVVHRRNTLKARQVFVDRAFSEPKIEFLLNASVVTIEGKESVSSVKVLVENGENRRLDIDALVIRIGVEPNSGLLAGKVALDEDGYVLVDPNCRTSLPHVFAVGDVANPTSPTIATATGTAATAAKTIRALSNA